MMYITQAKKVAEYILKSLEPHCQIIHIAGSVRREKPEVKDIEVMLLPKVKLINTNTLFDTGETKVVIDPMFEAAVKNLGKTIKGKTDGRMMQIETNFKIMLDLFMPDKPDYYRQLAIRTGSADYSHQVIANAWRKMGWCGSDKGLRMTNDCKFVANPHDEKAAGKWICINENAHKPPAWKSEKEFFEWLNVPFRKPSARVI